MSVDAPKNTFRMGPDESVLQREEGYYAGYQRLFPNELKPLQPTDHEVDFRKAPSELPNVLTAEEVKQGVHFSISLGAQSTLKDTCTLVLRKFVVAGGRVYGTETVLSDDAEDEEAQDLFFDALEVYAPQAVAAEKVRVAREEPDVAALDKAEGEDQLARLQKISRKGLLALVRSLDK